MNEDIRPNELRDLFRYIFEHGQEDRQQRWNSSVPLMRVINKQIPAVLEDKLRSIDGFEKIRTLGKSGASGRWSNTMYICILDDVMSTGRRSSITGGIYPAYLTSPDCSEIYLVYMLGIGSKNERDLKKMTDCIREGVTFDGYSEDISNIDLGKDPHMFKKAILAYRGYSLDNLPDDPGLIADILGIMAIHKKVKGDLFDKAMAVYRNRTTYRSPPNTIE